MLIFIFQKNNTVPCSYQELLHFFTISSKAALVSNHACHQFNQSNAGGLADQKFMGIGKQKFLKRQSGGRQRAVFVGIE